MSEAEQARRERAEARRGTTTLTLSKLGSEQDRSPVRGIEGMILAAELARIAWSMAPRPVPPAAPREVVVFRPR